MSTWTPLQTRYNEVFSHLQQERKFVENLFCDVLEIPDCTWVHMTDELRALECENFQEFDIIYEFYKSFDELLEDLEEDDCENIRSVTPNHTV